MAGPLPIGDVAPSDGKLPVGSAALAVGREFGAYVHVPFCRVRCGYCDFNTYTSTELQGAPQTDYLDEVEREIALAASVLGIAGMPARQLSTVFFGGGTPTLLPADDLVRALSSLRKTWGLSPNAEITTEANPDSVDAQYLESLAAGGFTRVSFGVQSAMPHVLATLDRTHDPKRVPDVVQAAKDVGLEVSVDLIYGTPGESLNDWRASLDQAISLDTGHISAYALIVEKGTALERRIRRGELATPDDDVQADMYELAEEMLSDVGFHWYEVSNWAKSETQRSRHNLSYWTNQDWWGFGPGAHSHIGGTRFWNVKHPAAYAQKLSLGLSPAAGREEPDETASDIERVLLEIRLREGTSGANFPATVIAGLISDGLITYEAARSGQLVLTLSGRLRADEVVRRLV
ncbi:radical SAM family heme chaperone HemW [Alpinimonas psychrophila]|uniref:Heme chaperone HemW n=1 Tax=Alpinimonas psychrophila TaxID=748908 RepID=A0A7W3PNN7_9MICO|nr:radical SAM family heme chaperone HemW [Alpinimonas psychrophila]MBA8828632.1 oxygen-independent coproporphyrinogen-3 oxidase [Alpinimonas psychrophila]